MDAYLWKADRYEDFLAARRSLLAKAGNEFLDSLVNGAIPEHKAVGVMTGKHTIQVEEDEKPLTDMNQWVVGQGLPAGILNYQLGDPVGQQQEIIDLAWPDGLQLNLSLPVAVFGNDQNGAPEAAAQAGFRVFTDLEKFKGYVNREVLAL